MPASLLVGTQSKATRDRSRECRIIHGLTGLDHRGRIVLSATDALSHSGAPVRRNSSGARCASGVPILRCVARSCKNSVKRCAPMTRAPGLCRTPASRGGHLFASRFPGIRRPSRKCPTPSGAGLFAEHSRVVVPLFAVERTSTRRCSRRFGRSRRRAPAGSTHGRAWSAPLFRSCIDANGELDESTAEQRVQRSVTSKVGFCLRLVSMNDMRPHCGDS